MLGFKSNNDSIPQGGVVYVPAFLTLIWIEEREKGQRDCSGEDGGGIPLERVATAVSLEGERGAAGEH